MHEANNKALLAWLDNRPPTEPTKMLTAGFVVILEIPANMTADEAEKNLRTCISFGKPEIHLSFIVDDNLADDGSYTSIGKPRNGPASAV